MRLEKFGFASTFACFKAFWHNWISARYLKSFQIRLVLNSTMNFRAVLNKPIKTFWWKNPIFYIPRMNESMKWVGRGYHNAALPREKYQTSERKAKLVCVKGTESLQTHNTLCSTKFCSAVTPRRFEIPHNILWNLWLPCKPRKNSISEKDINTDTSLFLFELAINSILSIF